LAITTKPLPETSDRERTRQTKLPYVAAALSGLLLISAFPHLDWGGLAWVALVPFLLAFRPARLRTALGLGAVLGLVFFGGLLYWIGVFTTHVAGPWLGLLTLLILSTVQAVTLMVFAGGAYALRTTRNVWAWRLGVPALWTVLEWTRQLGIPGMAWGDLAYTQHRMLLTLQTTKLTGVWGLAFLIVLVNVAVAEAIQARRLTKFVGATGLVVVGMLGFGAWILHTEDLHPAYRAAALQGNIEQDVPQDPAYALRVLGVFSQQQREAAAQGVVLTVWPETAFPGFLRYDAPRFAAVAAEAERDRQTTLVASVDQDLGSTKPTNALFLVTPQGRIDGTYTKQRLVPFGEYVPFRKYLPFLEKMHMTVADFAPGPPDQPPLDAGPPIGKIGAAICYDSTYGPVLRGQTAHGANLLVVSTYDNWYGRTAAGRQHAAMSAVRAAEDDRYLVRCAAAGVSQIIAPTGQVLAEAGLYRQAVVAAPVQSRSTRTLYVRWGDWFVAFSAGLLVVLALISVRAAGISRSSDR
jgi:apolipoprotein N-acyltransferase